jgi:hypothetical protein
MIDIIKSADAARVERLLAPRRDRDRTLERRVARIVEDVRADGDAALRRYAARFDALDGPFEVAAGKSRRGLPPRRTRCDLRSPPRPVTSRASRARSCPAPSE